MLASNAKTLFLHLVLSSLECAATLSIFLWTTFNASSMEPLCLEAMVMDTMDVISVNVDILLSFAPTAACGWRDGVLLKRRAKGLLWCARPVASKAKSMTMVKSQAMK